MPKTVDQEGSARRSEIDATISEPMYILVFGGCHGSDCCCFSLNPQSAFLYLQFYGTVSSLHAYFIFVMIFGLVKEIASVAKLAKHLV